MKKNCEEWKCADDLKNCLRREMKYQGDDTTEKFNLNFDILVIFIIN